MSVPTKVSVAILSWNGRAHLETCLGALAVQQDPGVEWEILVLDNGSNDGTAAWLREVRPARLRLIESPHNLGFCGGNNRLVAEASGDAIAFLNNDTRPRADWLSGLVKALASAPRDVAAVSGLILDWEGERLDFGRGAMTFDGHAFQLDFRRPLDRAQLPIAGEELFFACGGNMLIWRKSFLAAGGFDESYFAYLEDVDLGWRLWSGGERILVAPQAIVHHRSNATSDLLGLYNRGFLFERNAFLTAYKNYESGVWERMMPALLLTFMARTDAMLIDSNPGGSTLRLDPYGGWIANTASAAPAVTATAAPSPAAAKRSLPTFRELSRKLREVGPREFARRAKRRFQRPEEAAKYPVLTDERTIAQLRAMHYLLGHLEQSAEKRAAVQRRRQRTDREIFARFPLYLVPTYPGDQALFNDPGFLKWLPEDLPLLRRTLGDLMELG
jgi:GT2 family glycosyltransferase